MVKRLRQLSSLRRWDSLPWRSVETGNLGDFEEAVFYSLEEIDGTQLAGLSEQAVSSVYPPETDEETKDKRPKKKSRKSLRKTHKEIISTDELEASSYSETQSQEEKPAATLVRIEPSFATWNGIYLHSQLVNALHALKFSEPTPIQAKAVPVIMKGRGDVVGAAETGSGKTLAFLLPIIDRLLYDWDDRIESMCPFAIILTPTRELAMQIASVAKDLTIQFRTDYAVRIASVVGGMSVQKQRRLLGGKGSSAHIVVATPGRIIDLCNDETPALADLSKVRFLVVDEADRVVEEGHFPEVQRLFSRIKDHETIVMNGRTPAEVERERREGLPAIEEEEMEDAEAGEQETELTTALAPAADASTGSTSERQTLLFSATIRCKDAGRGKKAKGLTGAAAALPTHIQQLLIAVAVRQRVEVIDVGAVVHDSPAMSVAQQQQLPALPSTLKQLEIRVTTQDKDLAAYYYLLKNSGRTLLFVNSIKCARRVDGLLRALNVNSRTIHAQMQQRQRLRALDAFKSAPVGVLVATDVAARGLDIPKVQHVMHYDIARSPQAYVHRSGRTARAGANGIAISIVSPEDAFHHEAICKAQSFKTLSPFRMDPDIASPLIERINLARKIFTASFVTLQKSKEENWIEELSRESGLELDDISQKERGTDSVRKQEEKYAKRFVEQSRKNLNGLLNTPIGSRPSDDRKSRRKNSFIVVAN